MYLMVGKCFCCHAIAVSDEMCCCGGEKKKTDGDDEEEQEIEDNTYG